MFMIFFVGIRNQLVFSSVSLGAQNKQEEHDDNNEDDKNWMRQISSFFVSLSFSKLYRIYDEVFGEEKRRDKTSRGQIFF